MKKNGVILGLVFITIGFVILLKSFGIIAFSWWALFKTAPFAFIFIGIGILPIKKVWKALFFILTIIACVATMIYVSNNNGHKTWKERLKHYIKWDLSELKEDIMQSEQLNYFGFSDSVTHVNVNAEFAAGTYVFETKLDKKLKLSLQGNHYTSSVTEDATTGVFNLRPKEWDNGESNGKISLYEKFGYTFDLLGEKSEVSLNAEKLRIDTLNITANEGSSWHITLSRLLPETHVFIKAHPDAGAIELTLPASSGYQFTTTVISDDLQWNNLQPTEPGIYQSADFAKARVRVFIYSNSNEVVLSEL